MSLDERSLILVLDGKLTGRRVAQLPAVWQQRLESHLAELEAELQEIAGPAVRIERED